MHNIQKYAKYYGAFHTKDKSKYFGFVQQVNYDRDIPLGNQSI